MEQVEKEKEFWRNVSSQEDLPLAGTNSVLEIDEIVKLLTTLRSENNDSQKKGIIKSTLMSNPKLFHKLRSLVGISDKRAYLDLSYAFRNANDYSNKNSLCGCKKTEFNAHSISFFLNMLNTKKYGKNSENAAEIITNYLYDRGLVEVLNIFSKFDQSEVLVLEEKVISPHELQQSEAKRRGHGAEGEFARVVEELGCKLLPQNKAKNPMGAGDIRLNKKNFNITDENSDETRSYDIVITDVMENIRVCIIGLVHSSDPGEYGVRKASTTKNSRDEINAYNLISREDKKIFLCALVDGTGFSENKKDTINKILENVDYFVQVKTLYKIGLFLHQIGLCKIKAIMLDSKFYSSSEISEIKKNYIADDIRLIENETQINSSWKSVKAGLGILFI